MKKLFPVLAALILITGCSTSSLPFGKPEPERNVLTGLEGTNGSLVAVKFDDTRYAHPQKGLDAADIVFVTQVEAGLTRILAIYSSNYPDEVGLRASQISISWPNSVALVICIAAPRANCARY
jgi:hypothetical protein